MSQDVGKCPECGADLASPDAVNFGRYRRRPRAIWSGAALILSPLLLIFLFAFLKSHSARTVAMAPIGPFAVASQSNQAILAGLPKAVNQPWSWQELEKRLRAGSLSTAEVDKALNVLTVSFKKQRAAGTIPGFLPWSGPFVQLAMRSGTATPPTVTALYQAYYGGPPEVVLRHHVRQGKPFEIELNRWQSWSLQGSQYCWSLKRVEADGHPIKMLNDTRGQPSEAPPDWFSGSRTNNTGRLSLNPSLNPGEHELTFRFDLGVVPSQSIFHGIDGRPGTVDKWPHPITTWQAVVKRTIRVVKPGEPLVELVTDANSNPLVGLTLKIDQALVRPSSQGVDIVIKWDHKGQPKLPLSYRIDVKAGGQTTYYSNLLWRKGVSPYVSSSYNTTVGFCTLPSLAPSIKTIDVLLTPDPRYVEHRLRINQIWGRPIEFKNVPLKRFDLGN